MHEIPMAFPLVSDGGLDVSHGMTMRDWFAGQALSGLVANTKAPVTDQVDAARLCYAMADNMLAERAKAQPNPGVVS